MPSFPTLAVHDLATSTLWYRDMLNFELVFEMPGPTGSPVLSHLRWAKYADLLLVPDSNPTTVKKGAGVTLSFAMGERPIDDFSNDVIKKVATKTIGPVDQPWNAREFTVLDPDGYRLTFTQPINMSLSMDAVVDSISKRNH